MVDPATPRIINEIVNRAGGDDAFSELVVGRAKRSMDMEPVTARDYLTVTLKQIHKVISPSTPCKQGCSHCCNMAVSVNLIEAQHIAMAYGLQIEPQEYVLDVKGDQEKYKGVPCVFLKNGECGIYDQRPAACRMYYVLHGDNKRCAAGDKINSFDFTALHHAHIIAWGQPYFADIREFFPEGLG